MKSKIKYIFDADSFFTIPGSPIAYWTTDKLRAAFTNESLYRYSVSPSQNVTGNNEKYVKKHWELDSHVIGRPDLWIFYAKGGGYRKWWGNIYDVVNWTPQARLVYQYGDGKHASQIINKDYWYKKGITWSLINTHAPSFRVMPQGATYDKGGSTIIVDDHYYYYALGLLNSKVYLVIAAIFNPTLNNQVKDVRSMPLREEKMDDINLLVEDSIRISKAEWDSYETSWEFERHPLI